MKTKNSMSPVNNMSELGLREKRKAAKNPDSDAKVLASLIGEDVTIERCVARHPNANEDILRRLGSSADKTTRKYVTANPNSPKEVLLDLASQYPMQLLENPVFDLLFLENPNLLEDMPLTTLRSILKRENCPIGLLRYAANIENKYGGLDDGVFYALLKNENTPTEIIEELGRVNTYNKDGLEAQLHVNYPGNAGLSVDDAESMFWDEVVKRFETEDYRPKGFILPDEMPPDVAKKAVLKLAGRSDRQGIAARIAIASSMETAPEVLAFLAIDSVESVGKAASLNPNAPEWVRLGQNNDLISEDDWLKAVVVHSKCIEKQMIHWFKSEYQFYQDLFWLYPKSPQKILLQLAEDEDVDVRRRIAEDNYTPPEVLVRLAEDEDVDVRRRVADKRKHSTGGTVSTGRG